MRKRMFLLMAIVTLILNGCGYTHEVTRIFPVKDFIATEKTVVATFEIDGETHSFEFADEFIYPCEESSRIIGIETISGRGESWGYRLYLYLDGQDYATYIREKHNLPESFLKEMEVQSDV